MCKCANVQMCKLKKYFATVLFICTSAHLHICTLSEWFVKGDRSET